MHKMQNQHKKPQIHHNLIILSNFLSPRFNQGPVFILFVKSTLIPCLTSIPDSRVGMKCQINEWFSYKQ